MAGRGKLSAVEPIVDCRIFMFRNNNWVQATEPLHQDRPEAGIGLAMSFAASLLREQPDLRIGLLPCAVGATNISEWMPGTELYQKAINTTRKSNNSLQGVLWHQGEYDANDQHRVATYAERLKTLIESIRTDLNSPDLPFITGELGDFINATSGFLYSRDISEILKSLKHNIPNYACVSVSGLPDKGDGLHFSSLSLRKLGKRYAHVYQRLKEQQR